MLYGDADYASVEYASIISALSSTDKQLADIEPILEEIAKTIGASKAESESISDYLQRVVSYISQLSDSVTIADLHASAIGQVHEELEGLEDQIVKLLGKAFLETQVVADVISKNISVSKADTETIIDAIQMKLGRILAENENVADLLVFGVKKGQSESEQITTIVSKALSKVLSDTEAIVDQISKNISIPHSDAVGIADSILRMLGRGLSDSLGISDVKKFDTGAGRTEGEGIVASMVMNIDKVINDPLSISDQISLLIKSIYEAQDDEPISDQIVKSIGYGKSEQYQIITSMAMVIDTVLEESVSVNDVLQLVVNYIRSVSDVESIVDNLAMLTLTHKAESEAVADAKTVLVGKNMTEAVTVVDSINLILEWARSFNETLDLNEVRQMFLSKVMTGDASTISEQYTSRVGKNLGDITTISDVLSSVFIIVVGFGKLEKVEMKQLSRVSFPVLSGHGIKKLDRDNPKVLN